MFLHHADSEYHSNQVKYKAETRKNYAQFYRLLGEDSINKLRQAFDLTTLDPKDITRLNKTTYDFSRTIVIKCRTNKYIDAAEIIKRRHITFPFESRCPQGMNLECIDVRLDEYVMPISVLCFIASSVVFLPMAIYWGISDRWKRSKDRTIIIYGTFTKIAIGVPLTDFPMET